MIKAAIDIGSNSILLLVAEITDTFKVLERKMRVTGLGRGIDQTNLFSEIAMEESYLALSEYRSIINKYSINQDNIVITATEASRVAKNAEEFFIKIKNDLNFDISLISGEMEAYYSSLGVISQSVIDDDEVVIMDIGGASTEFILCNTSPFQVRRSISIPVGSVRMSDWMKSGNEQQLDKVLGESNLDAFIKEKYICVAGTMTSIGNMFFNPQKFDEENLNGRIINIEQVEEMQLKTAGWNKDEFLKEFPFLKKRARVIKGGLFLSKKILEKQKVKEIQVSTYGLMFGSILEIDKIRSQS